MTVQQGPDTLYLYNSAHIRQTLLHKSPMYPSAGRRRYLKGAVHIVLQCVAVCCSVLRCVAVCCSVLYPQEDAVILRVLCRQLHAHVVLPCVAVCCSVLQRAAVCCSVLQCVAVCCSVTQHVVGKTATRNIFCGGKLAGKRTLGSTLGE